KEILSQSPDLKNSELRWDWVKSLILQLRALHENDMIHGHVCLGNLVIRASETILLDHGFRLDRRKYAIDEFCAPELLEGDITKAIDIFGLAKVCEKLFNSHEIGIHKTFLSSMQAFDVHARPGISEVAAHFLGTSQIVPTERKQIQSGKLINIADEVAQSGKILSVTNAEISASNTNKSNILIFLLTFSFIFVFLRFAYLEFLDSSVNVNQSSNLNENLDQKTYLKKWLTGTDSEKKAVVKAAIELNSLQAQGAILFAAAKQNSPDGVNEKMILIAFDPRWAAELSAKDRKSLFAIALKDYVDDWQDFIPKISELHPGVILAILTDSNLVTENKQIANIEVERLKSLPKPIGISFDLLAKNGFVDFTNYVPFALVKIITGSQDKEIYRTFLKTEQNSSTDSLTRLLTLLPHLDTKTSNLVWQVLLEEETSGLSFYVKWFKDELLFNWNKIPAENKFKLMLGIWPTEELNLEQLADLITFPNESIANRAANILIEKADKTALAEVIKLIVSKKIELERSQVSSLILSLSLPENVSHQYLVKWFSVKPRVELVSKILLAIDKKEGSERLSIESARYLAKQNWQPSKD
ncbi:MAG: hypothetical protein KDD56_10440, partial [Bdellovibrionales bacterium]|nr:hypothetical protein [Bdellovibrionales bacterium]